MCVTVCARAPYACVYVAVCQAVCTCGCTHVSKTVDRVHTKSRFPEALTIYCNYVYLMFFCPVSRGVSAALSIDSFTPTSDKCQNLKFQYSSIQIHYLLPRCLTVPRPAVICIRIGTLNQICAQFPPAVGVVDSSASTFQLRIQSSTGTCIQLNQNGDAGQCAQRCEVQY